MIPSDSYANRRKLNTMGRISGGIYREANARFGSSLQPSARGDGKPIRSSSKLGF